MYWLIDSIGYDVGFLLALSWLSQTMHWWLLHNVQCYGLDTLDPINHLQYFNGAYAIYTNFLLMSASCVQKECSNR